MPTGQDASEEANLSREASTGRPPAKRPQETIESSSSPGESSSTPQKKRQKPSVFDQRDRVAVNELASKPDLIMPSSFQEERSETHLEHIYHNFDRFNRDKVASAIQGMQVELSIDLVSPRRLGIQKSVDLLLSLPKKYNYIPVVKSHTKAVHLDIKRHPTVWSMMAKHPTQAKVLMIYNLPQEEYSEREATTICSSLVEILNRWPADLSLLTKSPEGFKSGSFHARLLTLACRHKHLPDKLVVCPLPAFRQANTGPKARGVKREPHFQLFISCLHPVTFKQRDDKKEAGSRVVGSGVSIPEPSDKYQFVVYDTRGGIKRSVTKAAQQPGQTPSFPSVLPPQEELDLTNEVREGLYNAERLLRLYSASIMNQGGLIDTQGCLNIWKSILEKYGGLIQKKSGTSRGIFGGSDLLQVYPQHASLHSIISPGVTVENKLRESDDTYRLPNLTIRSIDRSWSLSVEQAISDAWLLEGDILKAWTRGAEAADLVNQAIRENERPPSACASGRYIFEYLSTAMRIKLSIEKRASQGIINQAEYEAMVESCFEELKRMLPTKADTDRANLSFGSSWRDTYSGRLHSLPTDNTAPTRTQPDRPSIDAVFPAWLTQFGYRMHCPGNLKITVQAMNYTKHVQIPAYLAMLCWYAHERSRIEHKYHPNVWSADARTEFDILEAKMVKISKRLRIIRLTFGWTKIRRLRAKKTTKEQFLIDLAPIISGQSQPELQSSMERLDNVYNFARTAHEFRLPESDRARIRTLVQEIQDFFDVQLPTGADGCPYFAHPDTMPEVWNWRIAFRLSNERLLRMKAACNRYWPTYDTVETIFLECIFQVCVIRCVLRSVDEFYELKKHLKAKYVSILGLPLAIAYHDGLTFSVGHAQHGRGMFTGWPAKPSRLDERLDADESNNIRIETRSENFLKADYDESTYSQLKQMIMDIDLPKDVYDKTLKPGKLSKEDFDALKWDGEDVNDDDLYNNEIALFDPEFLQTDESETPEASKVPMTEGEASQAPEQRATGETVPLSTEPSTKALGKMPLRVKSNETDYSEGLSAGELDSEWTTTMSGVAGLDKSNSQRQLTSRISSIESRYSTGGLSPETMEQSWSEIMGNEMETKWSQLMQTIEARSIDVSADRGLGALVDNLRNAKESGNEEAFTAIFTVIQQELS
ncbi:uncharacterized protein FSUBG_423 [Fusarium subglutinans]|uniref:Uncharacterized protein n=1 Tax=Gibberella subglutinans TaxID=42677 RepID=A0A8H5QDG4_GIBSU|nr:uncharacterized protein FSUBG_423 [Fusarium subglutinans]KAF5613811.1 hypothetical protein FSUBG_423 [Fusarium subglutinans]